MILTSSVHAIPAAVRQSRVRLMLDYPFLASAIASFKFFNVPESTWCPTMATDGMHIFVNPEWASGLSPQETDFVIAHEVLHCLLGHIDRRQDREPLLWNHAIDYATNALLVSCGLDMPVGGLFDPSYIGLSSEAIYERLLKGSRSSITSQSVGFDVTRSSELVAIVGHIYEGTPAHSLSSRVIQGEPMLTPSERRRLRASLAEEAAGKLPGSLSGPFALEVVPAVSHEIDWRNCLARFFSAIKPGDYRTYPFNKKHLWRGIYLPSVGSLGPDHIVVAIDTSASMSIAEIELVLGEIDSLRGACGCDVTVIQCDSEIKSIERFEPHEPSFIEGKYQIKGRGGTAFEPVFDWIHKESCNVDALVYLTDGFGCFPTEPPNFPVLWTLTKTGVPTVPWGQLLRLPEPKGRH